MILHLILLKKQLNVHLLFNHQDVSLNLKQRPKPLRNQKANLKVIRVKDNPYLNRQDLVRKTQKSLAHPKIIKRLSKAKVNKLRQ